MDSKKRVDADYLIRPLRCRCTRTTTCEFCDALIKLGGSKTWRGFVFERANERAAALEVLGERFGTRFFESC